MKIANDIRFLGSGPRAIMENYFTLKNRPKNFAPIMPALKVNQLQSGGGGGATMVCVKL